MKVMVDLDRPERSAVRLSSTPDREASTAGWYCPLYTRAVHEALRGKEVPIVQRLEEAVPSVWLADENPTMEDVQTWRIVLIRLLWELQLQFGIPFSWLTLQHTTADWTGGQCRRPTWPVFCGGTFAAFYRRESLKHSKLQDRSSRTARSPERRSSSARATFEELYKRYFRAGTVDESILDRVNSLSGDQVVVWSMLCALYTVDLLAMALGSEEVLERVDEALGILWPRVKRVAMGNLSKRWSN
ncbi:hypothetical protein Purlil1_12077 [Purpureocillium lilacinum]|uniref:Uncharacterized protein n=1 Tax=Purpureocillium lilacinum TaxID=33203 RepID=A0ABR0BHS6_PURLI|nr:hypothetical protein Purlil1_12077 [Purpureocillium lilacinum]